MDKSKPLAAELLYRCCDPGKFTFETTAELDDLSEVIGQVRAIDAAQFGIGMRREGYNLYVMGPSGSGKRTLVRQLLKKRTATGTHTFDWCYVNNFSQPHKPRAIRLPAGLGAKFRTHMQQLLDDLRAIIPGVFEGEEYRRRVAQINEEFAKQQNKAFEEVADVATQRGIVLLRTPNGFSFAPTKNDEVISPEDFAKLSDEEKERVERDTKTLQEMLEKVIHQVPRWRREHFERVRKLNEEAVLFAVGHLIDALRSEYADFPPVRTYLDEVQQNIIESIDDFRESKERSLGQVLAGLSERPDFSRYLVNLLVDHSAQPGLPVIDEEHPTYPNLIGRVEHLSQLGALVTNFLLIKPGALHLANGGYLLLNALKLITQPFSWEALKRALSTREIRIESLGQTYGLVSTVSLEPEPIPLDVKVVLIGDRLLYYLLAEYDPEFVELFKVAADFEDEVSRNNENDLLYARLIATVARREQLPPFDRQAVARVIEYCARRAGDTEKLSTHVESLADLVREAGYWAGQGNQQQVTREDVNRAIEAQIHRADRLRARSYEAILRGTLLIDTSGARVGQVNGLSVLQLGQFMFGQPSRITATTRLGSGELIDIQREVKLGGAIHSKGVLILASFLASRYATELPLSLSASLVFEQTYGPVEGDSASVAELCALLSSLSGQAIRQELAVTGSVDQFGRVQAIGGVNEKIEGFFDICSKRGLSGDQGVLIPAANVPHLMLRQDVVDAAAAGRFQIYAIETVDQAIEMLTSSTAGEADSQGHFPECSVNRRVADRLKQLAELRRAYNREEAGKRAHPPEEGDAEQS
ncbi:MAG TPA: ATP-binding protein [Burkholderiales bacterium]|nr:ATP-binding protein [Burkholderiales bacterium]